MEEGAPVLVVAATDVQDTSSLELRDHQKRQELSRSKLLQPSGLPVQRDPRWLLSARTLSRSNPLRLPKPPPRSQQ